MAENITTNKQTKSQDTSNETENRQTDNISEPVRHISSLDRCLSLVDTQQIDEIHKHQSYILNRLEIANAKLAQVNKFSIHNFIKIGPQIKRHTRTLIDTKKELDSIFRRIRTLQSRIQSQYPDSYTLALFETESTHKNVDNND
eukprot:TRINITY_DN21943_c0_g1_i1.p1 TRINITY_DN21943_c0_g1~~TRINITY_DN21943_c0_g1_i1.p1  ORF type:complete len:144 (+),score=19.44 TRINITY_DN21943_c0_g1_i1:54-485(+)